jgi:hypothetical protein
MKKLVRLSFRFAPVFDFMVSDFSSLCAALPFILIGFPFSLLLTEFLYGVLKRISDFLDFLLRCLLPTEAYVSGLIAFMLV